MAVPIKGLLAGAAVAGLGGTGVWLLHQEGMPEWRALDADTEFSATSGNGYTGKYAANYARFVTGVGTAKEGSGPQSNDAWWEWTFKHLYKPEDAKQGFKDLKRGAKKTTDSTSDGKSLQEKCDAAYKADATGKVKANAAAEGEYEESQFWKFCSFNGVKPKTLDNMSSVAGSQDKVDLEGKWNGSGKWGSAKKTDLLAIHSEDNEKIWRRLEGEYRKQTISSGFFANADTNKSLRDKCAEAYEQASTGSSPSPTEDDLYKWCSLKGSKPS